MYERNRHLLHVQQTSEFWSFVNSSESQTGTTTSRGTEAAFSGAPEVRYFNIPDGKLRNRPEYVCTYGGYKGDSFSFRPLL
jgi:hypothetical protein